MIRERWPTHIATRFFEFDKFHQAQLALAHCLMPIIDPKLGEAFNVGRVLTPGPSFHLPTHRQSPITRVGMDTPLLTWQGLGLRMLKRTLPQIRGNYAQCFPRIQEYWCSNKGGQCGKPFQDIIPNFMSPVTTTNLSSFWSVCRFVDLDQAVHGPSGLVPQCRQHHWQLQQ